MEIIATGRRYWGHSDMDGWVDWLVVESSEPVTLEDILWMIWQRHGIDLNPRFSGPGQYYRGFPCIRRTSRNGRRTLVCQRAGYDI